MASSARSGEQAGGREHDPCDERGNAGKQQDIIQDFGHDSLPRTEVPLPLGIGDPRTMAKRWQSPGKNACLGVYEPAEILARRPGYGPKSTARRARGPGIFRCCCRALATRVWCCSCITPKGSALNPCCLTRADAIRPSLRHKRWRERIQDAWQSCFICKVTSQRAPMN